MDTTGRNPSDGPNKAAPNILVIGDSHFGLAVAEYLTEGARSVTFVSENQLINATDRVKPVYRKVSGADDIRALASEITDIDLVVVVCSDSKALLLGHLVRRELDPCDVVAGISDPANDPAFEGTGVDGIDMPRLLAAQIRDRYK